MLYMRWTGLGWLTPVLVITWFFGGIMVITRVAPVELPLGLVVAAAMTAGGISQWLLGFMLNSTKTPHGRVWHDRHTYFDIPLQYGPIIYAVFALIGVSVTVGTHTSPGLGWLVFIGFPLFILVCYLLLRRRRSPPLAALTPIGGQDPQVRSDLSGCVVSQSAR